MSADFRPVTSSKIVTVLLTRVVLHSIYITLRCRVVSAVATVASQGVVSHRGMKFLECQFWEDVSFFTCVNEPLRYQAKSQQLSWKTKIGDVKPMKDPRSSALLLLEQPVKHSICRH